MVIIVPIKLHFASSWKLVLRNKRERNFNYLQWLNGKDEPKNINILFRKIRKIGPTSDDFSVLWKVLQGVWPSQDKASWTSVEAFTKSKKYNYVA